MRRRGIVLALVAIIAAATSAAGYAAWAAHRRAREARPAAPAVMRIDQDVQRARIRENARAKDAAWDWVDREIAALEEGGDPLQLVRLFERSPHGFAPRKTAEGYAGREAAALRVGAALRAMGRLHDLAALREPWQGKEGRPADWLALDADALTAEGRADRARRLLEREPFTGPAEGRRLARLAVLAAPGDPDAARGLLARAEAAAPADPDALSQRGRALEALGRAEEARAAFAAAAAAAPGDPLARDQLAEFYRRRGDYRAALATWLPEGENRPPAFVWLKAWFWARVAHPVAYDWRSSAPTEGRIAVLAAYLLRLEPGRFWGPDRLRGEVASQHVQESQEVRWLKVLGALQAGREPLAADLLDRGSGPDWSWRPDLHAALRRVLAFRGRGGRPDPERGGGPAHPFFRQLKELDARGALRADAGEVPGDVRRLLEEDQEAYAAVFLAAGWWEAARRFHYPGADLSRLPPWVKDEMTKALLAAPPDGGRVE
jgi:tetratricopeptide (TPR) repeat protein